MLVDMLKAQGQKCEQNMSDNLHVMLLQSAQMLLGWVWRHQNTRECETVKKFPKYNMNLL
jgi:hypothetical protein